ncbi:hypothetical protein L7F22_025265 [Adiantum nelumboides]|nr:hypothetical protein [Adiantum nelumboides]
MELAAKEKLIKETLHEAGDCIQMETGWDDLVDALSIHAYITKCKAHEAIIEEKRRREKGEGPSKRATKSGGRKDPGPSQEPSPQVPPPPEVPMEETSTGKEKDTEKAKGKSSSYKLQSDIEAATNLKKVLEERILNSKVEFTLGEVLGIAKREFHEEIIDIIKRKRQTLTESFHSQGEERSSKTHVIQLSNKKGDENVAGCYQSSRRGKQVSFADDEEDNETTYKSHYSRTHWAKATIETLVKVGNIEEPYVALIDHGSEINLMSKNLYAKGRWPIDTDHGWMVRLANNSSRDLYGACPNVKVTIGDVKDEQNFFVQEMSTYPLILAQPYITAIRMETKVMDDGSAYARIRSRDGKRAVQFLIVCMDHERNRDSLKEYPLPKANKENKDYRDMRGFGPVPL